MESQSKDLEKKVNLQDDLFRLKREETDNTARLETINHEKNEQRQR